MQVRKWWLTVPGQPSPAAPAETALGSGSDPTPQAHCTDTLQRWRGRRGGGGGGEKLSTQISEILISCCINLEAFLSTHFCYMYRSEVYYTTDELFMSCGYQCLWPAARQRLEGGRRSPGYTGRTSPSCRGRWLPASRLTGGPLPPPLPPPPLHPPGGREEPRGPGREGGHV